MTKDSLERILKDMLNGLVEYDNPDLYDISRSDIADICYDLFEEFRY